MTNFNLNRMLQGCSAFIQTMACNRAARNDAKRVNNHVLPLTCPLLASSLRLTCPLQLRRIALILCVLVLSVGQMWGESVTATYSHSGTSFNPVTFTTNDYFSAMTIATTGTVGGGTKTGARCNLNGNTSTTITFTYTAKSSFEVTSFKLNSFVNSNDVKNSVITYYKNSETPTELSPAIIFDKSDSSPSDKSSSTISESLNNGDVFTIKVSINNSTRTARQWYINTITLYLTASPTCTPRTFKSGEKIYFKDQSSKLTDIDNFWKVDGGNVYAYFWNATENAWSDYGDLVDGSWNSANAIYEITVPGTGKEYTHVLFTRGSSNTCFDCSSTWDKTTDQTPCEGKNLFYLSQDKYAAHIYEGSWGNFTPASKTVYFDNRNVTDWTTAYVRIGHGTSNSAWGPMTKVAGTRNLYSQTTSKWISHTDFSIANKAGWTGDDNHIDQPEKTYSNGSWSGSEYKMTKQTNYQQYAIEDDVYLCPKATSVLEHDCQFYQVTNANSTTSSRIDEGTAALSLPSYTVTSSASHCTVTMEKYNNDAGSSTAALASGGTVLPTQYVKVTVTPDANYQFGSVEVTGAGTETAAAAGTPGVYYITGDATITATCTCVALAVNRGGTEATPAEGEPLGTAYGTLTCSATTGVIASYQWKQNTSAITEGAVNAEGTGATTASFSPNPASAGTYYYYCVATDACGNSANTSFSGAFKFNAATYTVTYNKNGDGAGGAGSVTGTVPSDATSYTSGQRPVVKGPGDLAKEGHTFIGWNDAADGSGTYYSEKANFAISASKTLYAQWRTASSCPGGAGGTVFSLSMNNNTSSAITFNYGESKLLSSYATIQRGDASFTDIRTSNSPEGTKATITKASPAKLKIEGNDVTIMLFLDCALQQGDVLTFTETNNRQLYITTTPSRATTIATTSNSYTIPAESPLIGKRVIYLWRNSSTYNIDAITITRPASDYTGLSVEKDPSAGSASAPTISATSVAVGSGVTVTAGAASSGYVFTGWTSENGTFADANSLSTTFTPNANNAVATANYTATKTITIKFQHNGNTTGWTIQGKTTYPADQTATINVDGDWVVMTFSNVYAVSNIDLARTGGDWDYLNTSTKITDDACYNWTGTAISCATLTALVSGTRYDVADMVPEGTTITGSEQTPTGLSANTKFYLVGPTAMAVKSDSKDDVNGVNFSNSYYFKEAASITSNTPTSRAIKFIVPATGTLTAWVRNGKNIKLCKEGAAGTVLISSQTNEYYSYTLDVTAGTYYLYATAGSTTLYAVQFDEAATYTVTYNGSSADGGSGVPVDASSPYTSGSTVTVLGNTGSLTRSIEGDAATFYGWNTNSNMYDGTHYNEGETFSITANTTLYAVWGYTITWNLNSGEWVDYTAPTYYIYGQGLTLPAAAKISKSGYTFDHWELAYDDSTITAIADDATGNVTLNAIWTADASSYSVTYNGNDNTSGSVPTDDTDYAAGNIVTVKGNTGSLVKTGQTFLGWSTSATASSGTFYPAGYKFEMPASNVTLYAVWGSAAEEKYYYGSITITTGALTPGATGGHKGFFTSNSGVIASSNAISLSNTPSETKYYYESSTLTHTELNKSSNWNTTSTSKRTIRAFKFASGTTYTLALGSKVATSIMFYGKCGSKSKTMTVGDQEYESPSTADKFFSHEFTKSGNFTGNVSITQDGDFYGILVITISTGAASNFTVSFNMNGHGSSIDAIANVPSGSKIGKPIPDPAAVDWEFGGWYNEAGCTSAFDFATTTITADKTLYAKWTNCAPTVTTHPVAANYNQNGVASALTVVAATNGGGDLHYQWWVKENDLAEEDGSAIPGETGTSFTPSTELLGTSYYYCVVSNDCGNVKTNTAAVTIRDANPDPTAVWTVAVPTHGGKGFSFSVEVNKNDGSNWDGTLEASMLTLSSNAVLDESSIAVDNTNKTISGTYGVLGSATSPVTFYLLLPATATQAAARLDYNRTFTTCTGGGDGSTYRVPVRKDSEKDASNNYRWVTAGAGEISYTYGSSISSGKATSSYNSFDSIVSSDKQNLYVRTYNANIKKVTLYVLTGGKDITVESIYKQTSYKGADDNDKLSTAAYSVTYDDGSDENTGAKGNHYIVITLEDPLEANDILMFKFSKSNVKAYGAVFTQTADGGTETPTLGWSPSIDGNVEKNENAADFTYTATRSNDEAVASLGIISYSSSNTTVATVNATTGQVTIADNINFGSADHIDVTITATLSASGCYKKATTTYTLRVKKYVCSEAAGTIAVKSDDGCSKVLEITGYEADATIQWYKDGVAIVGEIGTTYTAASGGTYYAITHKTCDAVSNELTISTAAATATKIVDEWYVKNGRRTPDIALVQTTNATGFTVKSGSTVIWNSDGTVTTGFAGCGFYLGTDGIIYLKGQQDDGTEPSGLTAGNETITITASACVAASGLDIVIHKQASTAKPSIAFVVDGTLRKDGGTAISVLAAKTTERPIWTFLSTYYSLTGCNAYWSVNSKELRQYYSQFDAILITDDPNTSTEGTGGVSYVKAFGTMVDVRPVLTMEAYVGKFKDGGWHVYNATPSSPNPRQVEMKLECKNHDIFAGLDPSTMDNVRTETINGDEYWFVTMVDTTQSPYHNSKDDYEALPALQGFDKTKFSNMLGVGTIKNDELQAGVERQEEPAARMMILGIQNNAMAALTTEGKMVVKNALDYLLKTDMEDVNDCANYFLGTTNNQWNVASNWSRGEVPDFETRARILRPVVVPNDYSARVARVDIASDGPSKKLSGAECTGSLTISELGALVVSGKVSRVQAPYYGVNDLMPTEVSDVAILSGTGGNGTLIMDDASGENKAYVQMYSKAVKGSPTTWQYIGIPHSDVGNAMDNYYDSWLYSWSPSAGWEVVPRGAAVTPWTGYCISYPTFGHKYEMTGTLVATADVDIDVPANSYQIIGNSWVAPIQIANFEDEDFGDIPKTVYFFNTGSDTGGSGTVSENATGETRWAAGTYVAVPIHMAEYTGEDKIIPSMQGFYVGNTGSAGTLHLDYDKLVRQRGVSNYIQGQMHAPRRIAKGSNDPVMLKMIVRGSRYDDRLIVAEREDFTKGHDDGWDGAKWDGSTISPTIWSQNDEGGVESVTATPDMEGTIIGFRAGEDNEYTFHFEYDDMAEPLFLLDMDERMYVRILNDVTYTFTCADKGEHNRFLLTRKAPGIPTGCEPIDGGGGPKAMKFIKDNKLYILLNGVLYDATGKVVE